MLFSSKYQALQDDRLDAVALRNLYSYHPSYTTCEDPIDTAHALTDHVKYLFDLSIRETAKAGPPPTSLDRESTLQLLRFLSPSPPFDSLGLTEEKKMEEQKMEEQKMEDFYELDMAVDELMLIHNQKLKHEEQRLNLEMVSSSLLRFDNRMPSIDPKCLFDGRLDEKIFDPLHTKSDDFVAALDKVALDHDALNHHILTSLSMGSLGGLSGTINRLADFMQAYRHFTSTFCTHLEATIKMVGEMDDAGLYLEVLEENMEEEQGVYYLDIPI